MCHVKWYEVWAYRLRSPNGGGGDRPRPFTIIVIWAQALCWPRIAEIPLQGLVSAVALVLCIHTGVSELLAHDEWGGSSFLFRKAFSASCERGTEGVVTDRVRSESSRSEQALCCPSIAEVPLQALKSAIAVVLLQRGGGCRFE